MRLKKVFARENNRVKILIHLKQRWRIKINYTDYKKIKKIGGHDSLHP